jgi:adenylate cyclase
MAMRLAKRGRSSGNPNVCNTCEEHVKKYNIGAVAPLTMLFADVRGSTTIAEGMNPQEFTNLMNRFFSVANDVLIRYDAYIDKMVGDEVIGVFFPGLAGKEYSIKALDAARELLDCLGHADKSGPVVPVGVGIHSGETYVGTVGSDDTAKDVTVMGDNVNITARLASEAQAGEIFVSMDTLRDCKIPINTFPTRELHLKGKSESVTVGVLSISA